NFKLKSNRFFFFFLFFLIVYVIFFSFTLTITIPDGHRCTLETASDYVEFSNVYTTDHRVYRHCGLKHPKSIESDGDFFRVTFKSNGRFDGTGFKASYEFRYSPSSSSSSSSLSPSLSMDNNNHQQNENINENHQKSKTIKTMKTLSSSGQSNILSTNNIKLLLFFNIFLSIILMNIDYCCSTLLSSLTNI
ncbi:hypothetical protein DERP_008951, partial [Dermatophagoides pteronyssinus]